MVENAGAAPGFGTLLSRRPFQNLRYYLKARRHFQEPLELIKWRHYKGPDRETEHPLKDGRSLRFRAGTMDRHIVWSVFLKDVYRLEQLPDEPLDTLVDIGAQIGSFSLRMAPRARRIIAFEPVPANHALAAANLSGPEHQHIELHQKAVTDHSGQLSITLSHGNSGGHSAFPSPTMDHGQSIEVEALRLPDFLEERGIERVDFLKLDCEGAEYAILDTIQDWGPDRIRRLAVEYHPVAENAEQRSGALLERRFRELGYAVHDVPAAKDRYGLLFCEAPELAAAWFPRRGAPARAQPVKA